MNKHFADCQPHVKAIGECIGQCEDNFASTLASIAGITVAEGFKVLTVYRKHRIVTRDMVNRTYNVKHGAFLESATILNALAQAK